MTLGLDDFNVYKTLINSGHFVDLLQMSAYNQMRYSPVALENPGCVLFRFNETITISLRDVVLPLNVRFFVVEDLSSYNAILGQSWLNKMKVIPSTYH